MKYDFAALCKLLEAVWQQAYSDAAQGRTAAEYFLDATTGHEWRRRPLPPPLRRRGYKKVRRRDAMVDDFQVWDEELTFWDESLTVWVDTVIENDSKLERQSNRNGNRVTTGRTRNAPQHDRRQPQRVGSVHR